MRILVYEHFTAGGLLHGSAPSPELRAEGAAMLTALAADLARAGHDVQVHAAAGALMPRPGRTLERFRVRIVPAEDVSGTLHEGLRAVDAVWLVAPETDGCLEALTRRVLAAGVLSIGATAEAITKAGSKLATWRALLSAGVPAIATVPLELALETPPFGPDVPLVVKPDDGVGGEGLVVVRSQSALASHGGDARRRVVQPLVAGRPASVSLIAGKAGVLPLALQSQDLRLEPEFSYEGGHLPLRHRSAGQALEVAAAAVRAVEGLTGFVGVDLVLSAAGPVVAEVNPRLTTSYLGLRRAFRENLAALTLEAVGGGHLPKRLVPRARRATFAPHGRVRVLPERRRQVAAARRAAA